jgi:hypothetical protein
MLYTEVSNGKMQNADSNLQSVSTLDALAPQKTNAKRAKKEVRTDRTVI